MKKLFMLMFISASFMWAGGLKPVDNVLYQEECGSCHFAFQPGLLPSRSWEVMMGKLTDHFGVDASLDAPTMQTLLTYMQQNASEKATGYKRSYKMNRSIGRYETPLKISEVAYFRDKHRAIRPAMVNQKEVRSISNCVACHKDAAAGDFHDTFVPNYGVIDD
ncbi:MAG: diheme cytochrome c [Sulfurospirillum sp.]|nr:diheme cytochrome c [Sulfurospirillum sp.]